MAKPQVTITLGRSGQKVVKESWGDCDGGRAYASAPSGGKRSFTESSRSFGFNKRMREDASVRTYGYSGHINESHIGPKDLRVKLMHKRISRCVELENEKRKKMELHEKVSIAIRSLESPVKGRSRNVRGATEASQLYPMRSSYIPCNSNGIRSRSADQVLKSSALLSNPLDSSRPRMSMPTTSRQPLDAPATAGTSRPPYPDIQPLTVNSLLQSLGLAKYFINFQAEEIDMVALKQMGDSDLKELGIPMGSRKKILLALLARTKCPTIQALYH